VITGLPATEHEPHTGLPYATEEALESIHRLTQGTYRWMDDQQAYATLATSNVHPQSRPANITCSPAIRDAMVMAQVKAAVEQVVSGNRALIDARNGSKERSIYVENESDHWQSD
jgi:hypothetical protein